MSSVACENPGMTRYVGDRRRVSKSKEMVRTRTSESRIEKKRSLFKYNGVKLWVPRDGWDCVRLGNCLKRLTLNIVRGILSHVVTDKEAQRREVEVVKQRCVGYGRPISRCLRRRAKEIRKRWRGISQAPAENQHYDARIRRSYEDTD